MKRSGIKLLGNDNLIWSEFVIGCQYCDSRFTKTNTIEIEALSNWLQILDTESHWADKAKRTNSIIFLYLIDLNELESIFIDLMRVYKQEYTFAERQDFINDVFGYSINDLKEFIERHIRLAQHLGRFPILEEVDFEVWINYDNSLQEFIHYILPYGQDIDNYKQYYRRVLKLIERLDYGGNSDLNLNEAETKTEQEIPKTFEELFYNPEHAEPCLKILSELQPPTIDALNNYIGKAKGVFPLWVNVLKNNKPKPLIKHFKDTVYRDLLNQKVKGLNLTKDASEFRKQYVRLENNKVELDIKTILSQYSQSGKLGK